MKKIAVSSLSVIVVLFVFMYLNSLAGYTPFPGKGTIRFQQMQEIFGGLLFQYKNVIAIYIVANCLFSVWLSIKRDTRIIGISLMIISIISTLMAFGPGIHCDY